MALSPLHPVVRWTFLGLSGLLLGVGLARVTESRSEASTSLPSGLRTDLLLTTPAAQPRWDLLPHLDRTVWVQYRVGPREDLWSICKRFATDSFTVRSSNGLDVDGIAAGMVLRIPNHKGTLYQVDQPESLETISRGFSRGKTLKAAYDREILLANDFPPPNLSLPGHPFDKGTSIFLPQAWRVTGIQLPFTSGKVRITSAFGSRTHPITGVRKQHHGLDIAKPYGTPVTVARAGTVVFAGWSGGYGNLIEIRHVVKSKGGTRILTTRYGHLSKILVHEGQHVSAYQLIGRVGSTGLSTGPHLHFEVRDDTGKANNPARFQ